jgi:hypothetical protein
MTQFEQLLDKARKLTDRQKQWLALGLSVFIIILVILLLSLINRIF